MFLILSHLDALTPSISEKQNDKSPDKVDPPVLQKTYMGCDARKHVSRVSEVRTFHTSYND